MSNRALTYEQQVRKESLEGDLETLAESAAPSIPTPDISDDLLQHLVRQGSPHATLPRRFLARCGFELRAPDQLDDSKLAAELWKVIWVMGLLRMFLQRTDHLSDRQLYGFLYDEALQEPTAFMPGEENPPFYTIDPLAAHGREDIRLLLTYYRDSLEPEQLERWSAELADESVIPRPAPYDRDRLLP